MNTFNSIMLSDESLEILKYIADQPNSSISEFSSFPQKCLLQLLEYKLLRKTYSKNFSEISTLVVTELGKGYLYGKQRDEEFQQSVKEIADSAVKTANTSEQLAKTSKQTADSALKTANASEQLAKTSKQTADSADELAKASEKTAKSAENIADSAARTANKADIKSWISIGIAAFGVFIEFAIHHSEVIDFVKSILGV